MDAFLQQRNQMCGWRLTHTVVARYMRLPVKVLYHLFVPYQKHTQEVYFLPEQVRTYVLQID